MKKQVLLFFITGILMSCNQTSEQWKTEVYETSAAGNKMTAVTEFVKADQSQAITINPAKKYLYLSVYLIKKGLISLQELSK